MKHAYNDITLSNQKLETKIKPKCQLMCNIILIWQLILPQSLVRIIIIYVQ